jgi:1-acyl-sn-glycerol-3-phosphate acyltransferase
MKSKNKITGFLFGVLSLLILMVTITLGFLPILLMGLLKLYPNQNWKIYCTKKIDQIATLWCAINNAYLRQCNPTVIETTGLDEFNLNQWYLVIANHQSWLDIVILQNLFNQKIPVLKFFIKDQLKWVPLLGFAWWAMGCPFMKRYSKEYLIKNPHKKGNDLKATKKSLQLLKKSPSTLMSFVEGTRFTLSKKNQQNSPYQHLLRPKSGGIGFAISVLNHQVTHLIDVSIIYPNQNNSLWSFLCHRMSSIKVHIRQLPIPEPFLNAKVIKDKTTHEAFREWMNQQWLEKDKLITSMKN